MNGLFSLFSKRAETPVETRDYGKIYFALSALLFLGTMWAVLDEVTTRRPWKEYQDEYLRLSEQKWNERLQQAIANLDSTALKELQDSLQQAQGKLSSPEYKTAASQIAIIDEELLDANRDYTFAKSRADEAYYFWKKSVHEGHEDPGAKKKYDDEVTLMAKHNARVNELETKRNEHDALVKQYNQAVKDIQTKIKPLRAEIENALMKIERVHASTIQIKQVMSNNFDRTNFATPKARIDRCQTCHLGWNDENMDSVAQPFTSHPLPELLKLHNPETFGCTPCHRGQGTALTAGLAHGDEDHYWEWPLLKGKEVYASCNSCHSNELYVKNGDRFNKAKQMLFESGCFGCHEIKGYLDIPKIGPEINRLSAKTNDEWLFRWVRNPKDYNQHTRMPNFRFNDEQAEAITAYLTNLSKENTYPVQKGISSGGNSERGKQLVETVGCKGCHTIGEDTRVRDARGFSYDLAPELSRAGSKLDPDWAFQWIKNPRQYRADARMPSLRLTDQEAKDIVAYLMTLKDDRTFEQKTLSLDNPETIKKGDKLIREFGCAGCHSIRGMEKEGKVSVALSNFGLKRVDELDFGDTKVPHTWDDWVFNKIKDARIYTTDRIISKMPVFAFADSEIVTLRTLLRGFTKEQPEPNYQHAFDKNMQAIEAGRKLTGYYNCINCHQIEEIGGTIKASLEDEGYAPPLLRPEGAKVQEPWLHEFLNSPSTIRPWLNIRMPSFAMNDSEITIVSKYFLAMHKKELELRNYKNFVQNPELANGGKKLFEDFQCLSCHTTGTIPEGKSPSELAPNLLLAKNRLKPEWIVEWLKNPEAIQPGTRMPGYFPDMEAPDPEMFGGDALKQMQALRDHVMTLQGGK
ncbi:MAG: c-type cytochrome [Bacteroidetes bacterium]|nr:MAG: c-type cytochrome [Bacteroidota bacterium]